MLNYLSFEVYYFDADKIFAELQRKWKMITKYSFNLKKRKELGHRAITSIFENLKGFNPYIRTTKSYEILILSYIT